jgi:hypothetical protein
VTALDGTDAVFDVLASVFGIEVAKTHLPIGPGEPYANL